MEVETNEFDPQKILPPDILLNSMDSYLFRIGLSLFPDHNIRRNSLHNPKFMFFIQLQHLIRNCISLFASEDNPQLFVILGDFGYFLKVRVYIAVAAGLLTFLGLISQVLHYNNYKNGIKPSYVKPFEMMSGLVSPKSIGLTNREEIYGIIKVFKTLFIICKTLPILMFCIGFTAPFLTFIHVFSVQPFLRRCSQYLIWH